MNGCTSCGRVALEKNSPWWEREGVSINCTICGDTGIPSVFQNFPAGPRAPSMADDSYWRNEIARRALRYCKSKAEREVSDCFAILTLIKARLAAFRERVFSDVADRAQP